MDPHQQWGGHSLQAVAVGKLPSYSHQLIPPHHRQTKTAPPHLPTKGRRQQAECVGVYDQPLGVFPKYSAQDVGVDGDNRESVFGGSRQV